MLGSFGEVWHLEQLADAVASVRVHFLREPDATLFRTPDRMSGKFKGVWHVNMLAETDFEDLLVEDHRVFVEEWRPAH